MKYLWVNFVPIMLILLAGFLAYLDKDGYGWCIGLAVFLKVDIVERVKNDILQKDEH